MRTSGKTAMHGLTHVRQGHKRCASLTMAIFRTILMLLTLISGPRLPEERYVITVKLEQAGRAGFEPFTVTTAAKPALRATLKTRRGTVAPLEFEFTGTGTSASVHFFFPRTLDGAALLGPERDSAEFTLQGVNFSVRSKFTLDPEFLQ